MRVLHRNMLFPLAMDIQWEGTSSTDISSSAEDSEDDYVSAEEEVVDHSGTVTRSKAKKLQQMEATSKASGLLMAHFGDETFSNPELMVTSHTQIYIVAKFIATCREFWNKLSQ